MRTIRTLHDNAPKFMPYNYLPALPNHLPHIALPSHPAENIWLIASFLNIPFPMRSASGEKRTKVSLRFSSLAKGHITIQSR